MAKLSDLIRALHGDEDMRKLAQDVPGAAAAAGGGGGQETQSPVAEQTGTTIEDEKAVVQTKLMELAGMQEEAASATKTEEELNTAQEAPAGEKAVAPGVSQAASAAAPEEMATVVATVLSKMEQGARKQACVKIVEKIASLNALKPEDISDEKVAQAKFAEYDAIGRIMARGYHDEMQKIAAEVAEGETPGEGDGKGKGEEGKPAEKTAAAAPSKVEFTKEDLALLEALN